MPSDAIDLQAGALTDLASERRESVNHESNPPPYEKDDAPEVDSAPTEDELDGPNKLRRISAPIPWAVYTVAFVELCERFSYYGTQVVCMYSATVTH